MQHGGGHGWDGVPWMVLAAIVIVGFFLWYRSRSRKGGLKPFRYLFPGMGVVVITPTHTDAQGVEHEVTQPVADRRAYELRDAYTRTWNECVKVYGWGRGAWPIDTVAVVDGIVHEKHPHVMWSAPIPRVWVRLQDGMQAWLAGEVHNVFRYHLHGMKYIYKTVDDLDLMRAREIVGWIESEYGGPKC